jgi:hypothetical protein
MPIAVKSLVRKRAQSRISRRYLAECAEVCRQREIAHPNAASDITLEEFLRAQPKLSKGK